MPRTNDLAKLRAECKRIAKENPDTWTDDDRMSVAYYLADIAASSVTAAPFIVRQWVSNMHALEAYVAEHGDFPRASGLKGDARELKELRRLITWVETQRRAIRAHGRSTYQRRRLDTVQGFTERSHEGVWNAQFESYRRFIDSHPGAPRYRSTNTEERANASWAAKQRAAAKRGTLSEDRASRLRGLRIWTWS